MKFTKYIFKRFTYKGKTVLYKEVGVNTYGNPKYQIIVLNQHGADEFNNVVTYDIGSEVEFLFKKYYKK